MKVITEPTAEPAVLHSVTPDADADVVHTSLLDKSEHCVVHLCGCSSTTASDS